MTAELRCSEHRHIGVITLNRPQALNALTLKMIKTMQQQLLQWQQDEAIHAVVIQAESGKAFCAGGDVRWLYDEGLAKSPEQMQFFWHEYRLNHFIHQFSKPYIALMDGITMGGGVGISLHGSHPVASERFSFAMPETGIGFFPDIGASYLLSRCPGQYGTYLGLTGNRLNAAEARACGLIKYNVEAQYFPDLLAALINTDLSKDAHQRVDDCIEQFAMAQKEALITNHYDAIMQTFQSDNIEKIIHALEHMNDEWSQAILTTLMQKAPLSLKVTLAQIRRARLLSMDECIKMDYCLVSHFMQDHDFYEGVRALLVDKDKNPQWCPACLQEVSEGRVADYFECAQDGLPLYHNRIEQ